MASRRSWPPYQLVTVTRRQRVAGLLSRCARVGWRAPADPRPSLLAGLAQRGRIEQARIEPQAGDHRQVPPHRFKQLDGRIAHIGHDNDLSLGQPAGDLDQHLARPIGQQLVPTSLSRA